jgi:phosphoglucosamine mutase
MSRKYFGTDGVRGRVGTFPITPGFAMTLGWAVGKVLAKGGTKEVLIGKDTRSSGYMLESAMEAGFSAAGVNVALVGPMPTPAIAYLASTFRANAGVVISASHNPFYDNGIKFFSNTGTKLTDAQELEIEDLLEKALEHGGMGCVTPDQLGKARRISDAAGRYIEFCKGTVAKSISLSNLKIVVDTANGAAYHIAPNVYRELGAEVISINDKPNGTNINEKCGATHLDSLQSAVLEHKADIGIALDGDADRLMLVDRHGTIIDGDQILYLLAKTEKENGTLKGGVVGTLMSNLGLELGLKRLGIPFLRANVGDRYVVEQLHKHGWTIGGENSGHILHLDYASTGDGIVASLLVLQAIVRSGETLEQLVSGMEMMPQVLLNAKLKSNNADAILTSSDVVASIKDATEKLGVHGRVLLRKSGTEPLIRVMVESHCDKLSNAQANNILNAIMQAI